MIWFVLFVVAWLACGVVAGMLSFAWLQLEYPEIAERDKRADSKDAFMDSLAGPIALIAILLFLAEKEGSFKHGLKRFW